MVLILGNDPNGATRLGTRLGGILSARHGLHRTTLDRPSAILASAQIERQKMINAQKRHFGYRF